MKLFLNCLIFCGIASFTSVAFAQTTTTWVGTANGGDGVTFEDSLNWSNGVPYATGPGTGNGAIITGSASIQTTLPGDTTPSLTIQGGTTMLNLTAGNNLEVEGATPTSTSQDILINSASILALTGPGTLELTDGVAIIGNNAGSGTLNLSNGNINYDQQSSADGTEFVVGNGGTGTVNQGGTSTITQLGNTTVTMGNALYIGANGGTGTYNLNGANGFSSTLTTGTMLTSDNYIIFVGANDAAGQAASNGTMNISGNSTLYIDTATGQGNAMLEVGSASSVFGSSTISAGTTGSSGTINQNSANSNVYIYGYAGLGLWAGSTGTYNLSAGTLTVDGTAGNGTFEIGSFLSGNPTLGGTGVLNQTGGFFIGQNGSTINIGDNGTGTYNLDSGGTATLNDGLQVGGLGSTGSGTVNQYAGSSLTVGNFLDIGDASGTSTGTYNYYGGTLNLPGSGNGMYIGATGTFNQYGDLTLNNPLQPVYIDTDGNYNLSSGTLTTGGHTPSTEVFTGTGNFNFAGGTVMVSGSAWTDPLNGSITTNASILNANGLGATFTGNLTGTGTLNITSVTTLASGGTILPGSTVAFTGTNNAVGSAWGATIDGETTVTATNVDSLSRTGSFVIGSGSTLQILNATVAPSDTFFGNISDATDPLDTAGTANFMTEGSNKLVLAGTTDLSSNSITTIGAGGSLEVDNGTISNVNGSAGNAGDTFDVGSGSTTGTVKLQGLQTANLLPQVTVNSGSTLLAGSSSVSDTTQGITGDVTNLGSLGTLGSFASPGRLVISGNFLSNNPALTSVLLVNVNGSSADKFIIGGTATLSGFVNVVGVGSNTYTILTSSGLTIGGDGLLNDSGGLATNPPTALFNSSLSKTSTDLLLTTQQIPIGSYAQTPNQRAVAAPLDALINKGPPFSANFLPIFLAFDSVPVNGATSIIPTYLDELSPESLQYARDIAFENSTLLVQRMNGNLANLRAGYSGLDTSGLSIVDPGFDTGLGRSLGSFLAYNPPTSHQAAPNGVNYYPDTGDGGPSSAPVPSSSSTWNPSSQTISDSPNALTETAPTSSLKLPAFSEFISGDVTLASLNQDQSLANAPSSKASYIAGDVTAGVSFKMSSNLAAGVLFDYNHTNAKTDANGSKTTVDSYSPGIFATYFDRGFYVNGLFSFGYNNYSNTRNIPFLDSTAHSSPEGQQYVTDLDFGYDFQPARNWIVGPTLGLTYTHLDINSFEENGADGADLNVNSQSADSLRSRFGGHMIYQTQVGDVLLQPNLTAMWQHEYLDDSSGITSQFDIPGSDPFTIQTAAPSRDSALIGGGLTATLSNSMTLYLDYLADVGAGDYFAQSVVGGLKARF